MIRCLLIGNSSGILIDRATSNSRQNVFLGIENLGTESGWPRDRGRRAEWESEENRVFYHHLLVLLGRGAE